jgi:crotonobetainyl-CoA:carnitine CoA-transferase CaiB-like acyl-CoA transferase
VDVSMLDSMISTMSSNYMSFLGSNIVPQPMGTEFPTIVPYRVYRAADREIALAIGSEKLWATFCRAAGRVDLENHPEYKTNALRIINRETLGPVLSAVFSTRTGEEWITILQAAGVPCSLLRNFREVAEHPQSQIREMFPVLDHPTAGRHRVTGTPVKLSETPGGPGDPAPLLGQHTRNVLKTFFGLEDFAIDDLVLRRVVLESAVPSESKL